MVFSAIKEAWNFVDKPIRKLFRNLLLIRLVANVFDLIGTAMMAILVGYVVNVLSGNNQKLWSNSVIEYFNFSEISVKVQIITIGLVTLSVFMIKPLIVLPISKIIGQRIQYLGANLTSEIVSKFMTLPLSAMKKWSSSEVIYATTSGLTTVLSLLNSSVFLISDIVLIVMFFIALSLTNFAVTFGLLIYVILLFSVLNWISGDKISKAGSMVGKTSSYSTKGIIELVSMFRELTVSNRIDFQITKFRSNRVSQANSVALVDWLAQIPRFVIDMALVIGVVIVAIGQINSNSLFVAASTTALFLTAAIRILPSIGPIQGSINSIKNMKGLTERVHLFAMFIEVEIEKRELYLKQLIKNSHKNEDFDLRVDNLAFKYSGSLDNAINGLTFEIKSGSTLAIIGASGSGKTTLADCILGLLEPTSGEVRIDGNSPEIYRAENTGSISYVSQDVTLIDGSIKENVAFALPQSEIDEAKIYQALKRAHIDEFVKNLPQGLETVVGERGTRLSGGQRQRIGIARALYSNPKILVLDEATSALDAETEAAITGMLKELHGEVTIISIAHRLSTVMHSDLVLFLRDGKLAGSGKFEDLVKQHPDLAHQAELLGIDLDQN